jgi:hypothetical protein
MSRWYKPLWPPGKSSQCTALLFSIFITMRYGMRAGNFDRSTRQDFPGSTAWAGMPQPLLSAYPRCPRMIILRFFQWLTTTNIPRVLWRLLLVDYLGVLLCWIQLFVAEYSFQLHAQGYWPIQLLASWPVLLACYFSDLGDHIIHPFFFYVPSQISIKRGTRVPFFPTFLLRQLLSRSDEPTFCL